MPKVALRALPIDAIPGKTTAGRAMVAMILNNVDPAVAQFPHVLKFHF